MATATPRPIRPPDLAEDAGERRVLLEGIGWEGYEAIVALRGERRGPRLAYHRGNLELMSPGFRHESVSERLGGFLLVLTLELGIACEPAGATTLRRRSRDAGVEGDKTFYIAHEAAVRGKDEIDLDVDPPPDLAIEVEMTHPLAERRGIYEALGVPELWIYRRAIRGEEPSVLVLRLGADNVYVEAESSLAFPFLKAREINDWILRPRDISTTRWSRELRDWVREELAPRLGGV